VSFEEYLESRRALVEAELERRLPAAEGPASPVIAAMRYAVLGGGKRLRPILCLAACEACGGRIEEALAPSAALEFLHTYSLVHDDLPAMDDDDLRRGRPTVHRAFGEAQAILAGDGLMSLAFELLAREPPGERFASRRAEAAAVAARRAGVAGMVGGQMADLEAERGGGTAADLEWIHRHKTGALLAASAEIGAILAGGGRDLRASLARYGEAVGLAFQIADDILDVVSTAEALGKTPGKDRRSGKLTYPALYGVERSRSIASALVEAAVAELAVLPGDRWALEGLARYAISRTR